MITLRMAARRLGISLRDIRSLLRTPGLVASQHIGISHKALVRLSDPAAAIRQARASISPEALDLVHAIVVALGLGDVREARASALAVVRACDLVIAAEDDIRQRQQLRRARVATARATAARRDPARARP